MPVRPGCPVEAVAEVLDPHSAQISVQSNNFDNISLECHFDLVIQQAVARGEILGIYMNSLLVAGVILSVIITRSLSHNRFGRNQVP